MLLGRVKKVISGLVALSMLTTFAVPSGMVKAADSSEPKNPVVSKTETTWDRVVFGSYYSEVQEKDVPITWRVLNVSGNDAFLISDEILAMKNYNDEAKAVTWADSSLRSWLNDDFFNYAFTEEERAAVIKTEIQNNNFDLTQTDYETTNDYVYLPSYQEMQLKSYGFSNNILDHESRLAYTNTYLEASNIDDTDDPADDSTDIGAQWLLRTNGENRNTVCYVDESGALSNDYDILMTDTSEGMEDDNLCGVRPVLHLDLSKTDCYTVTSSFTQIFDPDWGGSDIDDDNVKVNLWSCVWFGNYYQSDEKGQTKDPIKWRVLKKDGNDLYLMADKLLDVLPYGTTETTDWSDSTLRTWLNDTFINEAFNDTQKAAIVDTSYCDSDASIKDKIAIPSKAEATLASEETVAAGDEEYCTAAATVYSSKKLDIEKDTYVEGSYWLRDVCETGYDESSDIAYVEGYKNYINCIEGNSFQATSAYPEATGVAVRPVLHLDVSKTNVWQNAGEICENEEINEIPYGSGTADISKIKSPTLVNDDYTGSETVYKVSTWDCVWFGNYYQTSSTAKTPVKWRVLDKDDTKNTAVLIADAVLDAQRYDEDGISNGWSDATLREWLNTTMYQELFSEQEKEAIVETDTTVKQEGDEDGEAATGSAISTTDRVYLLAESDFVNELYGLIQEDADVSPTCKAIATAYLEEKYPLLGAAGTVVNWWMRDKGYSVDSANYVDTTGTISEEYKEKLYGIRPVITVDLSKATLYDAGTVSSDGKIEEKAYPDNTTKDPGDNGNIGTKDPGIQNPSTGTNTTDNKTGVTPSTGNAKKTYTITYKLNGGINASNPTTYTEGSAALTLQKAKRAGYLFAGWYRDAKFKNAVTKLSNLTQNITVYAKWKKVTVSKVSLKKAKKSGKKKCKLTWKKCKGIAGYEIACGTNKKFKKAKKTTAKAKVTSKKITIKKGKKNYIRIRAFAKDSMGKKVYGKWSKVKVVK